MGLRSNNNQEVNIVRFKNRQYYADKTKFYLGAILSALAFDALMALALYLA